ncbi:MAG: SlyX family protein [Methylococcales bacterium]|nr:SlyX family protein [Methylococcales bacterium]
MTDNRITELEIKIAYQEDLLQSLNTIVSNQQLQIGRLEETCKFLNERINNERTQEGINQGIEKPPHF